MVVEKAIVTNVEALRRKYGARLGEVRAAVRALVAADARRGITSRVYDLASRASLAPVGARPVDGPDDRRGAKRVVDAIDLTLAPSYIVLLGAPDVVPMQRFANLLDSLDPDGLLESDLPYASDEPPGRGLAAYLASTRVVGRIPDVPGATQPDFLLRVLAHAARARTLPRGEYERAFALSAESWLLATRGMLEGAYGHARRGDIHLSPGRESRPWPREALARRLHYLNCHGGAFAAMLEGELEGADQYRETALDTRELAGKVRPGTVVVTEACFGAHLYDPADRRAKLPGELPIALDYLRQGAWGVFGAASTTYGGYDRVRNAGTLCLGFLRRLLAGASLGRATLEARHAFLAGVREAPNPIHLKTLAQFSLLGDPSIHPVRLEPGRARRAAGGGFTERQAMAFRRQLHRENLRDIGLALREDFPEIAEVKGSRKRRQSVDLVAGLLGVAPGRDADRVVRVFDVVRADREAGPGARRIAVGIRGLADAHAEAIVAQLAGGQVVSAEKLVRR